MGYHAQDVRISGEPVLGILSATCNLHDYPATSVVVSNYGDDGVDRRQTAAQKRQRFNAFLKGNKRWG